MAYFVKKIINFKTLTKIFVAILIFSAIFSIGFGMYMDENGNMAGCLFLSEPTSICSMGFFEHIEKWQQFFTATFFKSQSIAYLIFLLILFSFIVSPLRSPNSLLTPDSPALIRKSRIGFKLFNYLVIAFSKGILQPRLYA